MPESGAPVKGVGNTEYNINTAPSADAISAEGAAILILGHPLIGFAVIIGKADKVAGVRVMEADFAGKAAYIGNFQ